MPSFTISNPSISRTSSSTAVSRFPASSSTPSTPSTPQPNSPLSAAPIYKKDAGSSFRTTLNKSLIKGAPEQDAETSLKTLDGQNVTNMPSVIHESEIEIMEESSEGASQKSTNAPATEISLLDLIAMQMLEDGPRPKKRQHWIMDWWRTPSFKKNAPSIEDELKAPIADAPRAGLQPKKRQHWIMDWWRTPSFKKNAPSIEDELKARIADLSKDPSFKNTIKKIGLKVLLMRAKVDKEIKFVIRTVALTISIPILIPYLLLGCPFKEKVFGFFDDSK